MNNNQKIKCLFGYHEYTIPGNRKYLLMCRCLSAGRAIIPGKFPSIDLFEYDDQGNEIYYSSSVDGTKEWYKYNNKGRLISIQNEKGTCVSCKSTLFSQAIKIHPLQVIDKYENTLV